jgi:hypothetical protein
VHSRSADSEPVRPTAPATPAGDGRAGLLRLQRAAGNRAVARWLSQAELAKLNKSLKAQANPDWLEIADARPLIDQALAGREELELEIERNQLLESLGYDLGNAGHAFQAQHSRMRASRAGPISGLDAAHTRLTESSRGEIPEMIAGLTIMNVFAQHDGDYVRYDRQNPSKTHENFQIQIGGKKDRQAKGKMSVTTVLPSIRLVQEFDRTRDAAFREAVVERMRLAHAASYAAGVQIQLDLDG